MSEERKSVSVEQLTGEGAAMQEHPGPPWREADTATAAATEFATASESIFAWDHASWDHAYSGSSDALDFADLALDAAQEVQRRTAEHEINLAILGDQKRYLITYAQRLIDRIVGIQLSGNAISFEQAQGFVASERAAADAELRKIEARHRETEGAGE